MKKNYRKIIYMIITFIFIGIGIFSFIKIRNKINYEKTYNYKLESIGYNEEEIKTITTTYQDNELNYILNNEKNTIYSSLPIEKYFIYNNFYDYIECSKETEKLNTTTIVEKVNTKTNHDFYTDTEEADTSKNELMLVNKYYYLSDKYEPDNLVSIPPTYAWGEYGTQKVTKDTYNAFLNLWEDAKSNGFYLMVNSSYRPQERQQSVYENYEKYRGVDYADSIAARPGYSEHQTGYSLDIFEKGYTQDNFKDSDSYSWLINNAHKYGFILRYPEDKEDVTGYSFEAWHYRYVGEKAATYIHNHNITFDEYYAYFVK